MPTGGSIDEGLMLQVRSPRLDAWPFAMIAGVIGTVATLFLLPDAMSFWGMAFAAVFLGVILTVLVGWPLAAARRRRSDRLVRDYREMCEADILKSVAEMKARDVARPPELS